MPDTRVRLLSVAFLLSSSTAEVTEAAISRLDLVLTSVRVRVQLIGHL